VQNQQRATDTEISHIKHCDWSWQRWNKASRNLIEENAVAAYSIILGNLGAGGEWDLVSERNFAFCWWEISLRKFPHFWRFPRNRINRFDNAEHNMLCRIEGRYCMIGLCHLVAGDDSCMAGGESRMTGDCSRPEGSIHRCERMHSHLYSYIYGLVALLDNIQSSFSSITISTGYEPGARYDLYYEYSIYILQPRASKTLNHPRPSLFVTVATAVHKHPKTQHHHHRHHLPHSATMSTFKMFTESFKNDYRVITKPTIFSSIPFQATAIYQSDTTSPWQKPCESLLIMHWELYSLL